MAKNRALQQWRVEDSIELYGIRNWGAGYFDVSDAGEVVICPQGPKGPQVSIPEVISGLRDRGYDMPVLLRVENILDSRIANIHGSFRKAIKAYVFFLRAVINQKYVFCLHSIINLKIWF